MTMHSQPTTEKGTQSHLQRSRPAVSAVYHWYHGVPCHHDHVHVHDHHRDHELHGWADRSVLRSRGKLSLSFQRAPCSWPLSRKLDVRWLTASPNQTSYLADIVSLFVFILLVFDYIVPIDICAFIGFTNALQLRNRCCCGVFQLCEVLIVGHGAIFIFKLSFRFAVILSFLAFSNC